MCPHAKGRSRQENIEGQKVNEKMPTRERQLGSPIRSFYPLNHPFHVPRFFAFEDPELSATRRAGGDKVEFLMRRQHQVVTFAAPGNMIAESTPVRDLAFFPLDRHIFIKFGHSRTPGKAFYSKLTTFTVSLPYGSMHLPKDRVWRTGRKDVRITVADKRPWHVQSNAGPHLRARSSPPKASPALAWASGSRWASSRNLKAG